ncbi:MAG: O-methyltransferase [Chitinophagaceae bacterium]
MELINPLVLSYSERFSTPEDGILHSIAEETSRTHAHDHMLVGHVQGKFLQFISEIMQPRRILEIGTFTGYSAICLSKGLQPGGKVHTIEIREEDAKLSQHNFNEANVQDKIILHTGNALSILPALDEEWDLVFIDADKPGYIKYYELVIPRLRKGGVILADNVLFHGQVLGIEIQGKSAIAIQAFNEHVFQDNSVEKVLLTIRDGLLMIIKK